MSHVLINARTGACAMQAAAIGVSMDLVTLDITDGPKAVKPGARVEFLGEHAKLEAQAAACGTLGYELLTGLGPRVQRNYR
jgi:alanine racemase